MAEFDPDKFLGKDNNFDPDEFISGSHKSSVTVSDADEPLPSRPEAAPPDPGFWPGVGRVVRGTATGVESTIDEIGMRLPGFLQGANDPKRVKKALSERPKPASPGEAFSEGVGEVLPTFAIPNLGLERLASSALRAGQAAWLPSSMWAARAIPTVEKIGGAMLEGGVRGGIGGAMMPEGDRAKNTDAGAAAGMAVRGTGAALGAAWNALPPQAQHLANAVAAGFAVKGMEHLGLPNDWLVRAPVFFALWRAKLIDLANQMVGKASRINPAAIGAGAVEGGEALENQRERTKNGKRTGSQG